MMSSRQALLHRFIGLFAIALFVIVLLVAVSEASPDSEGAVSVTFDKGTGSHTLDGQTSLTYGVLTGDNSITIPDYTFSDSNGTHVYSKDGYSLSGWKGKKNTYDVGDTYNKTGTLTAQWSENLYTFYANGGRTTNSNQAYTAGIVTNDLVAPDPTYQQNGRTYNYYLDGYVLVGWSTSETSTVIAYYPGQELEVPETNVPLYAVWKELVGIMFDPNGGTATPESYSVDSADIVIPGNIFTIDDGTETKTYKYLRSGYTFLGWSTTNGANNTVEYVCGDTLSTGSGNIILYAVWSSDCKIIFDPNGGNSDPSDYSPVAHSQSVEGSIYVPGSTFTVDDVRYTYSWSGHSFLGWSTNKHSKTPEYVKGNLLSPTETGYVLYAVWNVDATRVTFDYGDGYTAEVEINYGYTFDSSSYMMYAPEGMGDYKIVGWCTGQMWGTNLSPLNKDMGNAFLLPAGDTYSKKIKLDTQSDITLYPIWALKVTQPSSTLTFTTGHEGCYYVDAAAASKGIVVSGGSPRIYLDSVSLDYSSVGNSTYSSSVKYSPFIISGGTATIVIMGDCYFKGADEVIKTVNSNKYSLGYAGINVQSQATLVISKDSLGKLTARGGNVTTYSSELSSKGDIDGRAGAGIGANGNASDSAYDDGCGYIKIEGGIVSAYGGNTWVYMEGAYYLDDINFDVTAGPGIGGTTSKRQGTSDLPITITGGTITAATGHLNGKTDDSNNRNLNSYSYYYDQYVTFTSPIYDGTNIETTNNGTNTSISSSAMVTKVFNGTATSNSVNKVKIYFSSVKEGNTEVAIGNALSVTLINPDNDESNTIDIGMMRIQQGTTIEVDGSIIDTGYSIILTTQVGNYFKGTIGSYNSNSKQYTTTLTLSTNSDPHGTVDVYANEVIVNGNEPFGSITPYPSVTIGGTGGSIIYPFTLSLNEGYVCTGVKFGTKNNSGNIVWDNECHDMEEDDEESVTSVNGTVIYRLRLSISTGGTGTANYISFCIERIQKEVTILNTYDGNETPSYYATTVTSNVSDPTSIVWNEGNTYTLGKQFIYYKESVTYTIDVTRETGNPFIIRWITVNGNTVTPEYDSEHNNGRYTLAVNDISDATTIEIRYGPTVKLSGYTSYVDGFYSSDIKVQGVNADGSDGFLLDDGTIIISGGDTRSTKDTYVDKGTAAYFKIYTTGTWYSSINGEELGIQSITIKTGSYTRSMNANVNQFYVIGIINEDTQIDVKFTGVRWDLIFNSDIEVSGVTGHSEHKVTVVDRTFYDILSKDQLTDFSLNDKAGYDLLKWHVVMYDSNLVDANQQPLANMIGEYDCNPGDTIQVTCKLVLTAVWSTTPHQYVISYDVPNDDLVNPVYTYTVEDELTINTSAAAPGFDFVGWIVEGSDDQTPHASIRIDRGTIGDISLISVWDGKEVTFNLYDPKRIVSNANQGYIGTQTLIIGSPYDDLPVYSNRIGTGDYANKKMVFAGWSHDSDGTQRITESEVVEYNSENVYNIYVIWVESTLYIVNITNDGSYGGTVTASVYGQPGTPISLTITAYTGFKATKVIINDDVETIEPDGYPYVYPCHISTSSGVLYFNVTVKFEKLSGTPIPRPTPNNYVYDGTEKTGVVESTEYTVTNNKKTDSGLYHAVVTLNSGYIWEDDGSNDPYEFDWEISKRKAYIIAISEYRPYTGQPWVIPETTTPGSTFKTLCVIADDIGNGLTIKSSALSITSIGVYTNEITVTGANNYEFVIIKGTYAIYSNQSTSSITVELTEHAVVGLHSAMNGMSSTDPGRIMANVPTIGRRKA